MNVLAPLDYAIFLFYFLMVSVYGYWIYRKKRKSAVAATHDYFLAEGSLTWWAIGASLIASNISAEQFIGMSGSGFKMGLAIASYEWMSALTLILVAVFFIPVYLKNKILTMPQFLKQRYSGTVSMIMAVFWLLLYIVVNLTSILYLGALAINSISGFSVNTCMYGLAIFAILITLGGMKVIGYTDVVQVFFLILGGLATAFLALHLVGSHFGVSGLEKSFLLMTEKANDHFHMILKKDNSNYIDLPGLSVLIGGMWIANLNYWGCNQYITQRALGADLKTARSGILFAAFLKLLMPVIVVLPGIAAFVLYKDGVFQHSMSQGGEVNPDRAYPVMINLLPAGLKGLSFAALTAAIVASLAGKANSIATIFALDIYKKIIHKTANEKNIVLTGKLTVIVSVGIAILIAPHLGIDQKGGFQYIQEYSGFVSPGILAMFLLGFFWKKTTSNAALFATLGGFLMSIFLKIVPKWFSLQALHSYGFSVQNAQGVYEIPFMDRMALVFAICILMMIVISKVENRSGIKSNGLAIDKKMFVVGNGFLAGALIIAGILVAIYSVFW